MQSALALWGLQPRWQFPLHVSSGRQVRRPGIVTHETAGLTRTDIRTHLGIRVTSPARTLLDCAPDLGSTGLGRVAADARRRGYLHIAQIADVLARFRRHPGRMPLLEALGGLEQPTRSELEEAFLAFCRRHDLPTPQVNTRPGSHECDFVFPDAMLIVEVDGWDFHRDKFAYENDRDRDADMLELEYGTLRATWSRLMYRPEREAQRLHRILETRRRALRAAPG
jgi:very-short-patch-repair endonuclease